MVNFAAMADGFRQQGESDHRKRSEMAKAFQEFRAANPEAGVSEFQSFIDQMSGGRNYLRGGAPSGEVLQQIAASNAEKTAQRKAAERLAAARSRAEFRGALEAQIDDVLLNMEDDDYGAAGAAFMEDMGGDLGGIDVRGMLTPARRQRAIMDQLGKNWGTISGMLESMDPEQLEAGPFAKMTGLAPAVAQAAIDKYKKEEGRKQNDYVIRRQTDLINFGMDYVERGFANPREAIESQLVNDGVTLPPEVLDRLEAEALKRGEQKAADREREIGRDMMNRRQEALNFLIEQSQTEGFEGMGGQQLKDSLAYFYGIEPDQIPGEMLNNFQNAFQQRKAQAETERKRAEEEAIAAAKQKVVLPLMAPGFLTDFAEADDARDAIMRQIEIHIGTMTPEQQAAISPADRDDMLKTVLTEAQVRQDQNIQKRRDDAMAAAASAVGQKSEESQTYVDEQMTGKMKSQQADAAMLNLATRYYMDPKAHSVLVDAFAATEGDLTAAEFEAIGARALEANAVPTLTAAEAQAQEIALRKAGAVENDLTWNEYVRGATANVSDFTTKFRNEIGAASQKADPILRLERLQALRIGVENSVAAMKDGYNWDQQNARHILTVGEGNWDDRAIQTQVVGPLDTAAAKTMAEIDRLIATTQKAVAQTEAVRQLDMQEQETADKPKASASSTPAGRAIEGARTGEINTNLLINEAALPYQASTGIPLGVGEIMQYLMTDDATRSRRRYVVDFVDDKGIRDQLLKAIEQDRSVLHAFQEDPLTFIETSDLPFVVAYREKKPMDASAGFDVEAGQGRRGRNSR